MFTKLFHWRKRKGRRSSKFIEEWNDRIRVQHDELPKAGFFPIPEHQLSKSYADYDSNELKSNLIANYMKGNRDLVFPIRVLFNANLCLAISESSSNLYSCLSAEVEKACAFKIEVLNQALEDTPLDLLVLMERGDLPDAEEWCQETRWIEEEFSDWGHENRHSLFLHVRELFLRRIECSCVDFIAFKEAAITLRDCGGIFTLDELGEDKAETSDRRQYHVNYVVQDIFSSIRKREKGLLSRNEELAWRVEGATLEPIIPRSLIGISE